jgi:hypothetical protein
MTYLTNAIAHGIGNSTVSSQWYNRPDDQKFLSIDEMLTYKKADAKSLTSRIVDTHRLNIIGTPDEKNPSRGSITVEYDDENGRENMNTPTNWVFWPTVAISGSAIWIFTQPTRRVSRG